MFETDCLLGRKAHRQSSLSRYFEKQCREGVKEGLSFRLLNVRANPKGLEVGLSFTTQGNIYPALSE